MFRDEVWTHKAWQRMYKNFLHRDNGTVVVHKWITDVRYSVLKGRVEVRRYGGLEDEDMPRCTRKVIGNIWDQVPEDMEVRTSSSKKTYGKTLSSSGIWLEKQKGEEP